MLMPIPRAQSAMEYLTTYGWAILIITVAFMALYSFGIFDMNTYGAGALPGSCQVYRPYGQEPSSSSHCRECAIAKSRSPLPISTG